jgi:transcriptional regulator with XRE-family HTH domain
LHLWTFKLGWTAHKLTDAEVAAKTDGRLSRSQVSRIRRRKSIPPPETAKVLAEITTLPAEVFVFVERAA